MDLQIKQRKGNAHKSIRKIARLLFDKKKYRSGKLGNDHLEISKSEEVNVTIRSKGTN